MFDLLMSLLCLASSFLTKLAYMHMNAHIYMYMCMHAHHKGGVQLGHIMNRKPLIFFCGPVGSLVDT